MPKNIIFCADGTWNHPDEKQDGKPADTNVRKFFDALPDSSSKQAKFYDDGVGADGNFFTRMEGGAFGSGRDGLFKKVKDGYRKIAESYEPGDKIYLTGFSRGAYTARSIAGMIASIGLPDKDKLSDDMVEEAFQAYRQPASRDTLLPALRERYGTTNANINIEAVGVWDTVGSMGVPGGLFADLDREKYGFLDTTLHPNVKAAFHAMAIDEKRSEFQPTPWTPPFAAGQKVEQVWFPGVHSDVGGGYSDSNLSDVTLGWMMKKMAGQGVGFKKMELERRSKPSMQNALGQTHESWKWYWGPSKLREIPKDATLAENVLLKMADTDLPYQPGNLPADLPSAPGAFTIENVIPNLLRSGESKNHPPGHNGP